MIITVAEDGRIGLLEPGDFRRFSIRLSPGALAQSAMAAALRTDGDDHAWVPPDLVRRLAGHVDPGWDACFEKMLAFAAQRGWLDEQGAIRAHIERDA